MARQIAAALAMPRSERRARWQQMSDHLLRHSIHRWFADFMQDLKIAATERLPLTGTAATLRNTVQDRAALVAHS